jgi:hypothetical protein
MITPATFSAAQAVIGKRWREDQPPEREQILGLARDALDFVSTTGQRYSLEDFRTSSQHDHIQNSPGLREDPFRSTEAFFLGLFEGAAGSTQEQELIQLIIDTLRFIVLTRQQHAFDKFRKDCEADAPPFFVASFATREEAEAWLQSHPSPPDFAEVLIAGKSYEVIYDRKTNLRRLRGNRTIHHYLAGFELSRPAVATFATQEEAEAWLRAQPEPAKWAKVLVGGAPHLAVYYSNINQRVLYPLSPPQEH